MLTAFAMLLMYLYFRGLAGGVGLTITSRFLNIKFKRLRKIKKEFSYFQKFTYLCYWNWQGANVNLKAARFWIVFRLITIIVGCVPLIAYILYGLNNPFKAVLFQNTMYVVFSIVMFPSIFLGIWDIKTQDKQ